MKQTAAAMTSTFIAVTRLGELLDKQETFAASFPGRDEWNNNRARILEFNAAFPQCRSLVIIFDPFTCTEVSFLQLSLLC